MDLISWSVDIRYCQYCGAQIQGPGSWPHDDNCRTRHEQVGVGAVPADERYKAATVAELDQWEREHIEPTPLITWRIAAGLRQSAAEIELLRGRLAAVTEPTDEQIDAVVAAWYDNGPGNKGPDWPSPRARMRLALAEFLSVLGVPGEQ